MNDNTAKTTVNKMSWKMFFVLHFSIMLNSLSSVCSKIAASKKIVSTDFFIWFGLVIIITGIYAIVWQQILKRLPLITAYINKPMNLIWGIVWGNVIFHEKITSNMFAGSVMIFLGIYMVVTEHD